MREHELSLVAEVSGSPNCAAAALHSSFDSMSCTSSLQSKMRVRNNEDRRSSQATHSELERNDSLCHVNGKR